MSFPLLAANTHKTKIKTSSTFRNNVFSIEFLERKQKLITKGNSKYVTFCQPITISYSTNGNICTKPIECMCLSPHTKAIAKQEREKLWPKEQNGQNEQNFDQNEHDSVCNS